MWATICNNITYTKGTKMGKQFGNKILDPKSSKL